MTLTQKIKFAINDYADSLPSYARDQYEDNYDGFTHSSYAGLLESVIEELVNEGYDENAPMSVIENLVFELWN